MVRPRKHWTPEKDDILRRYVGHMSVHELERATGIGFTSIRRRLGDLGIEWVPAREKRVWTPEEDAVIKKEYGKTKTKLIAERLNRHPSTIWQRARTLKGLSRKKKKEKPDLTLRNCLCCGKEFPSHGIGNRLCVSCNKQAQNTSVYAP